MSAKKYKSIFDVFDDTDKMEEILTKVLAEGSVDLLDQIPAYGPNGESRPALATGQTSPMAE